MRKNKTLEPQSTWRERRAAIKYIKANSKMYEDIGQTCALFEDLKEIMYIGEYGELYFSPPLQDLLQRDKVEPVWDKNIKRFIGLHMVRRGINWKDEDEKLYTKWLTLKIGTLVLVAITAMVQIANIVIQLL